METVFNAKSPATHNKEVPTDLPHVLAMCVGPHIPLDRNAKIAEYAYSIAERRGFAPGHELDDWLQAEHLVDCRICGQAYD
jgi:DUF2934 family protein